jgi:TrkA domain protein
MPKIEETHLPGLGVRHEFTTEGGEHLVVLTHRSGRRDLALRQSDDPDASSTILELSPNDVRTLVEILGGSQVSETVAIVQQQIEGLAIEWISVSAGSTSVGASISDGAFRTRTGASIVAVIRGDATVPAPGPEFVFAVGDVVVAVGTPDGLEQLRNLLAR